jgi:hypothetical protein
VSAGRRAAVGSPWSFMLTGLPLFAGIAGIAAPLYMQLLRLTLGLLSLSAGGHMRTRPGGGSVFQAGPNWPPVVCRRLSSGWRQRPCSFSSSSSGDE